METNNRVEATTNKIVKYLEDGMGVESNNTEWEAIKKIVTTHEREVLSRVGMLRQWLNEDRITDSDRMVTNEQLLFWLTGDEKYLEFRLDMLHPKYAQQAAKKAKECVDAIIKRKKKV